MRPWAFGSFLPVLALAVLVVVPSAAQPPTIPFADECAGGGPVPAACLDTNLGWAEDAVRNAGPVPLPDGGFVVAGTVAGRQWPAARVMPAAWPSRPVGERDAFVARYRAGDIVADWVVPFSQGYITHVLPAPGGALYVFGTSSSPRVPEPPLPGTYPETRQFLAILESDGRLRSIAFTSNEFMGTMAVNAAGEIVVAESGRLSLIDPVTLQQRTVNVLSDINVSILSAGSHVVALVGWHADRDPLTEVRTLVRWRSSDLAEDGRVSLAGLGVLDGLSIAADDDDHLWLAVITTGATLPLSSACPAVATPTREVLLLRVEWGSRSVASARCIARMPPRTYSKVTVTHDGHAQVMGFQAPANESQDRYEPVVVRTDDGGRSWRDVNDGLHADGTVVPVSDAIAYLYSYKSIHRTSDGGQTWRDVSLSDRWSVTGLSVNPNRPADLWVQAQGPGYEQALFRSRDGGESWTEVVRRVPDVTLPRWFDPSSDRVWGKSSELRGWAVSDDQGVTWRSWGEPGMWFLDGAPNGRSYANGDTWGRYGLHWSADGGQSWSPALGFTEGDAPPSLPSDLPPASVPSSASILVANPREPAFAIAASTRSIFATTNGGASWQLTGRRDYDASLVAGWTSAGAPVLYQWRALSSSTLGGPALVWRSDDLGATWQARAESAVSASLAPVPGNADVVYATGTSSIEYLPYREFDAQGQLVLAADIRVPPGDSWLGLWARAVSTADADANGLTDTWEVLFGPALGGPDADPDGDGRSNRTEMVERTHPTATWTAAFAEGFGPMFRTGIDVWNPSVSETARVWLRSECDGMITEASLLLVPPQAYRHVEHPAGAAATTGQSLVIESDVSLVASRTSMWGYVGREWMHAATAASPQPSRYFAEGSTQPGFETFYLLHNPGDTPTDVRITWLPSTGTQTASRTIALAPHARASVWVNAEVPELGHDDVAAIVESLDGVPIVAERSVYHANAGGAFDGGTSTAGASAPSTSWIFAEGASGGGFETYLLLANPTDRPADVNVQLLYDDGTAFTRPFVVAAKRRLSIDLGAWLHAHASFSVVVTASHPIVAERATWWPNDPFATGIPWWAGEADGHVSTGAIAGAERWSFTGGAGMSLRSMRSESTNYWATTYLSIAKLTGAADSCVIRFTSEGGDIVEREIALPAGRRRVTVSVSDLAADAPGPLSANLAIDVEVGHPTTQIVVEQSVYAMAPVTLRRAGASMTGVPSSRR